MFRPAECEVRKRPRFTRAGVLPILVLGIFSALPLSAAPAASADTDPPARDPNFRQSQSEVSRRDGDAERKLLADLEAARSACADHFDSARFDRESAAAFRGYGLDLDQLDAKEAGARLTGRPSTPGIAAAIDEWCFIRRTSIKTPTWRRPADVARAADPDPWRDSLRDQYDRPPAETLPSLRALAAEATVLEKQPVQSLILLTLMLKTAGDRPTAATVLRVASRRFPGDFWVCFQQGTLHAAGAPNPNPSEAARWFRKAVALTARELCRSHEPGDGS